jgi:hypothetical protein
MDLGSLFIIVSLTILVGIFVSRPLLDGKFAIEKSTDLSPNHELSSLLAERDRLLNSLQELDFDAALGKIPPEDYPDQRARLLRQGADILRQIDKLSSSELPVASLSAESRIESVLAERRLDGAQGNGGPISQTEAASAAQTSVVSADDEVEVMLANRRRRRQGQSAGFCHKCGGPLQKIDVYCPKCGVKTR